MVPSLPPKNVSPVGTGRKVSNFIVVLEKVSQVHSVCHPRTKATKSREVGRCVQLRDVYRYNRHWSVEIEFHNSVSLLCTEI